MNSAGLLAQRRIAVGETGAGLVIVCREGVGFRTSWHVLFQWKGEPTRHIHSAYGQGYWLAEIAAHVGIHAATVSHRLKQAEDANV